MDMVALPDESMPSSNLPNINEPIERFEFFSYLFVFPHLRLSTASTDFSTQSKDETEMKTEQVISDIYLLSFSLPYY
jgi:hypothetical protein